MANDVYRICANYGTFNQKDIPVVRIHNLNSARASAVRWLRAFGKMGDRVTVFINDTPVGFAVILNERTKRKGAHSYGWCDSTGRQYRISAVGKPL